MQIGVYDNFLTTIKSKATRIVYHNNLHLFMQFLGIKDYDQLLKINAEDAIKQYIIYLKDKVSSATLHNRIAAIYHFYTMNDIVLNKTKISKFKGEFRKVKSDRAYTREEIHKMLQIADLRMKIVILLMASSGLRSGSLADLKMRNLEGNKLTVYENTNEEYFTFVTPECHKFINDYMEYRKRNNEEITPDSYLIRNHFDDYLGPKKANGVTSHTIRSIIHHILKSTGLKVNVQMTHGFRKFFTTQFINSKVNSEIREMLLGHKIGLASAYYRPTEQEMYLEYEKAIDLLTINEENRLKIKIQKLEVEKSRIEKLEENFKILQKRIK